MKKILCFVLTVICLLAVAGCGGESKTEAPSQKQAVAEKVLRVGTDADYPPFEYFQEASKAFTGFDIELMRGIARELGYSRVEFVDLEFNNLLPSLKDGQVDAVISCMNITEERKKVADFTEPYLDSVNVAVGPFGTKAADADVLKDKRIAVEVGSVHVKQAKAYSDNVVECGEVEDALKMVAEKKADFTIMDNYTARFYITQNYSNKLTIMAELKDSKDAGIAIAVAKNNKELLDKLNAGLQNYRTSANFLQLRNSYFGKLK